MFLLAPELAAVKLLRVRRTAPAAARCAIMKLLALLAAYLGVTAGLFGGLTAGVLWLVRPDPAATREPRAAPISPRIAESIERKMAPPAPSPVITETKVEAEPAKPVMKEADVALTHAPRRIQVREFSPQQPIKRKLRDEPNVAAQEAAPEAPPARAQIPTSRTDFPY